MKLLVILLTLLSERYLIHSISLHRFSWFGSYFNNVSNKLPKTGLWLNSYIHLLLIILPFLFLSWIVLGLSCHIVFGFFYLLLNLVVFYYCIGPTNPFYPTGQDNVVEEEQLAANYFYAVNSQLFAVILWYILLGPLAIIAYRLTSLCQQYAATKTAASNIMKYVDWISARVTVMLYLLVGNFQQGLNYYSRMFLTSPENNYPLLSEGGLLAARMREEDKLSLSQAQTLVEHALIVFLVLIAFFTLVAWL